MRDSGNGRIADRTAARASARHDQDRASVGHDRDRSRCRLPRRQAGAAPRGARAHARAASSKAACCVPRAVWAGKGRPAADREVEREAVSRLKPRTSQSSAAATPGWLRRSRSPRPECRSRFTRRRRSSGGRAPTRRRLMASRSTTACTSSSAPIAKRCGSCARRRFIRIRIARSRAARSTGISRSPVPAQGAASARAAAPCVPACSARAARRGANASRPSRFVQRDARARVPFAAGHARSTRCSACIGQGARVRALLVAAALLAALNTPPALASAQVFLNVLRDSLDARPRSVATSSVAAHRSDRAFPRAGRQTTSGARRDGADRGLHRHGRIAVRTTKSQVLHAKRHGSASDHVICAVSPHRLERLVSALPQLAPGPSRAGALPTTSRSTRSTCRSRSECDASRAHAWASTGNGALGSSIARRYADSAD